MNDGEFALLREASKLEESHCGRYNIARQMKVKRFDVLAFLLIFTLTLPLGFSVYNYGQYQHQG